MKEKILCMVDKYFPDSSANTICCKHVMDCLKKKGYQVDVLTVKQSANDNSWEIQDNTNIIKLENYQSKFLRFFGKYFKANKWNEVPSFVRKAMGALQSLKGIFRAKTNYVALDSLSYSNIYKQITRVEKKYDIIISFCMPFTWNVIAYQMLKKGLADRWYPILLDAYVYNKTLKPSKINYRKKLENKFLSKANFVFVADGTIEENLRQGYIPEFSNKLLQIHLPVLTKLIEVKTKKKEKKSNTILVYTGLFYEKIRNPEKMLDILSQLEKENEIRLFGDGCEDVISKKKELFKGGNLFVGGRISHKQCLEEIDEADILINLGNVVTNQMPSKIFEYISYGKPIINFYFTEEDMCLKVFDKYPLVFSINLNDYNQKKINELKEFIQKNKNIQLDYEQATKSLVEYRVENIVDLIYNQIKKDEQKK